MQLLSVFGTAVLIACLFGRNLQHLYRPSPTDREHDPNGDYWKRHRALDNIILNVSLSLPAHVRMLEGMTDPAIVFLNMCLHSSAICLHQAAIFKINKHNLSSQLGKESRRRCLVAANTITNHMKMICHTDLSLVRYQNLLLYSFP